MVKKGLILILILSMCLFAFNVMAYLTNQRPVTVDGTALQDYFDDKFGSGTIDVYYDQLPYAIFTPGSDLLFTCTLKSGPNGNTLGIYPYKNPNIKLTVIPGTATESVFTLVFFYKSDTGYLVYAYYIENNTFKSLFSATFPTTSFGFYLTNSNTGETWYSEDSLNNSEAHALFYAGLPSAGDTGDFYLAWESSSLFISRDYADAIYVIGGADPVPEPATLFLLGTGLLSLASIGRRKLKNVPTDIWKMFGTGKCKISENKDFIRQIKK